MTTLTRPMSTPTTEPTITTTLPLARFLTVLGPSFKTAIGHDGRLSILSLEYLPGLRKPYVLILDDRLDSVRHFDNLAEVLKFTGPLGWVERHPGTDTFRP